MNIVFITTENFNVGDDFVREGLKYLLTLASRGRKLSFTSIHKHAPVSVRNGLESIRSRSISTLIDGLLPSRLTSDKIRNGNLIIQSGAPVYWCHPGHDNHCSKNEWYHPLIRERFDRYNDKTLLNLAAGSCQGYHSVGNDFCSSCNKYIQELYDRCRLTTVRDQLAAIILQNVDRSAKLLPCSSIFAADYYGIRSKAKDYLAVNFMRLGAHYTLGQNINTAAWLNEFRLFYKHISQTEKVIFACHSKTEVKDVRTMIDPAAEIFYSRSYLDYIEFYSRAKMGIMNRVHGIFMLASFGAPSVAIGNDSRVRMCREIGLESHFVNDMTYEKLLGLYYETRTASQEYKDRFESIKTSAKKEYLELLKWI